MLVFVQRPSLLRTKSLWIILLIQCYLCGSVISNNGQSLNCGRVCLLTELSCSCELVTSTILGWRLLDVNMSEVGQAISFSSVNKIGDMVTFANEQFSATLTNVTEMARTSVATGTVSQTIEGYTLHCLDAATIEVVIIGERIISIPDEPSQPENLTAKTETSTGSVLLSWAPPINSSECVVSYIITSTLPNSNINSISTTLNHTLNPVDGVILICTYTASVAANDTAGTMGSWSQVLFSFNGSSSIVSDPPSQITEFTLSYLSNNTVMISWILPNELLLECTVINISTNASAPSSTTNSTSTIITRPDGDPEDATYTVTIAPMDMAGRTGKQSEATCFSFKTPIIQSVHSNNDVCTSTIITIQWTVEMSQCLPTVTSYFITVTNVLSGAINSSETNETTWALNDVHFGDEYDIEIVPHSALGNGSINVINIRVPDTCPTTSRPFPSSTTMNNRSMPTGSCVTGINCLVIGISVAIPTMAVLIMILVSSLVTYFIFCKKKRNRVSPDSKVNDHSSTGLNSETESADQGISPTYIPQAYMSPSDVTKEYTLQKLMSEKPKSEYASPQDAQRTAEKSTAQFPMYQEIDLLNKEELPGDRELSAQEKRVTLNKEAIIDTVGYSDLPACGKKSSAGKKSRVKSVTYTDMKFSTEPNPPVPPAEPAVQYASVQMVEYATVQKKK